MPLLSDNDRQQITAHLEESLKDDVTIRLFTESAARTLLTVPGQPSNEYVKVTQDLMQELAETSAKISLEVLDFHGDGAEEAKRLNIEQIPAIVLGDDPDGRVRFYGAPIGNEFMTILEGIEALSRSEPRLNSRAADAARQHITEPVHLRVFVTPT